MNYADISIRINGRELEGIESISYTPSVVTESTPSVLPASEFSYSAELKVDPEGYRAFFEQLTPRRAGASDATLAKRAIYGGRKGRRARARLRARGFLGIWRIDGGPPMPAPPFTVALDDVGCYLERSLRAFGEVVGNIRQTLEAAVAESLSTEQIEARLHESLFGKD